MSPPAPDARTFRTLFLSDTHLGCRGCHADQLLDLLETVQCDKLVLLGDLIDGKRLSKHWYWDDMHEQVVQAVLRKARKGTEVIYIPGNHDNFLRAYTGETFAGIRMTRQHLHTTLDGKRLWLLHGDEFDGVISLAPWLALLGDRVYEGAVWFNHHINRLRRRFNRPYWSLAMFLKNNSRHAARYVAAFEDAVCEAALEKQVDGVVCGHIHVPRIKTDRGLVYFNTGDWLDHCTALVEHVDGSMELLKWQASPLVRIDPIPEQEVSALMPLRVAV